MVQAGLRSPFERGDVASDADVAEIDNMIYDQRLPAMAAVMMITAAPNGAWNTTRFPPSTWSSWKPKSCRAPSGR